MAKQPTDLLANYVHRLRYEDLPREAVEAAKLFLLDYLASAMAGYKINRIFNEALWGVVGDMGGNGGTCRIAARPLVAPCPRRDSGGVRLGTQRWSAPAGSRPRDEWFQLDT